MEEESFQDEETQKNSNEFQEKKSDVGDNNKTRETAEPSIGRTETTTTIVAEGEKIEESGSRDSDGDERNELETIQNLVDNFQDKSSILYGQVLEKMSEYEKCLMDGQNCLDSSSDKKKYQNEIETQLLDLREQFMTVYIGHTLLVREIVSDLRKIIYPTDDGEDSDASTSAMKTRSQAKKQASKNTIYRGGAIMTYLNDIIKVLIGIPVEALAFLEEKKGTKDKRIINQLKVRETMYNKTMTCIQEMRKDFGLYPVEKEYEKFLERCVREYTDTHSFLRKHYLPMPMKFPVVINEEENTVSVEKKEKKPNVSTGRKRGRPPSKKTIVAQKKKKLEEQEEDQESLSTSSQQQQEEKEQEVEKNQEVVQKKLSKKKEKNEKDEKNTNDDDDEDNDEDNECGNHLTISSNPQKCVNTTSESPSSSNNKGQIVIPSTKMAE